MKSIIRLSFLCFALIYLSSRNSFSQTATASLDNNSILIGKQVHLILELKHNANQVFHWPSIPDTLGKIEIVSRGSVDTIRPTDSTILERKQVLTITAFDSGYFVIPPFDFIQVNGSDTFKASTNPLLLTVMIMPIDTTKAIHDIKGLAEVPFNWRDYISYILISLAVVMLILAGIYIYYRFWKKVKVEVFASKPKIPAHEVALAALRKLDDEKQWQSGRFKLYHSSISEIIRTFIEQRWQVHAMEQTTDEIMNQHRILELETESKKHLEALLKLSDLAKFAKLQPLANENEQSMRDAVNFVKTHAYEREEAKKETEKV